VRPLIGITTYREHARWGDWDDSVVLLPATYPTAVARAGGEPVLLPTGTSGREVVARLDGLVLSGGPDVDPARYGQQPGPHTGTPRTDRDETEAGLLAAALDAGVPVLAVCRGMQLLNVALGGDLIQHLPDVAGVGAHDGGPREFADHQVRTIPGSRVAALVGDRVGAHCHHHQAVGTLAPSLRVTATAEDGTVEAVERAGDGFCLGVQWHPEAGADGRLFEALVAATRG